MGDFKCIVTEEPKQTEWDRLSNTRLLTRKGFQPEGCRHKVAHEVDFPANLKRREGVKWAVPLKTQKIYAYAVEDCDDDRNATELINVKGGVGKRSISCTVQAEKHHGAHVR